jgi:hypothetical protein
MRVDKGLTVNVMDIESLKKANALRVAREI